MKIPLPVITIICSILLSTTCAQNSKTDNSPATPAPSGASKTLTFQSSLPLFKHQNHLQMFLMWYKMSLKCFKILPFFAMSSNYKKS